MPHQASPYRGRFAPSPTGPLHLGSLITALASYLDARHRDGVWLVRMEDLDPPREEPGAADSILESLDRHGLHWDESVIYQGTRTNAYEQTLAQLRETGLLFACDCTRAVLGDAGQCLGNCRARQAEVREPRALRIAVPPDCHIRFEDELQGEQHIALGRTLPDFVLKRKDGLHAYQLAVVVDDAAQDMTHILRGSDLLDSTARQVFLQQSLGLHTPSYCHVPVITNSEGQKFSKQNMAPPIKDTAATGNLRHALHFLRQPDPPESLTAVGELLDWATTHWALSRIPVRMAVSADSLKPD